MEDNQDREEQLEDRPERFEVNDDESANWCVRRIAEIRAERARQEANFDREIARYQARREAAVKQSERDEEYFCGLLARYMERLSDAGALRRTKSGGASYRLPDGRVRLTPPREKFTRDADRLLRTLNEAGRADLIRVKYEPDWISIRARLRYDSASGAVLLEDVDPQTGEVMTMRMDGVTWALDPAHVKVEVDE